MLFSTFLEHEGQSISGTIVGQSIHPQEMQSNVLPNYDYGYGHDHDPHPDRNCSSSYLPSSLNGGRRNRSHLTVIFSSLISVAAIFPEWIKNIIGKFCQDTEPVRIEVGSNEKFLPQKLNNV